MRDEYPPAGRRFPTRHSTPPWEPRSATRSASTEAHILITAAAPIHPDLIRWLHAIGLPVIELYGQTEVCGPTTCNPPEDNRIGTVGRALPGVRVRIADDGEILVQGGNVCAGYFNDPAGHRRTARRDGWMHSGDLGTVDADGYLRLTGRKKDLIITAAGQNIAPQDIEMELKNHPLVSEAVVIGEGRRYLTALLTLDAEALAEWAHERGKVADYEVLVADPDLREEIDLLVTEVNARRSRVEGIRKHRILAHELTVAAGELTPTLKVKRAVVCEAHQRAHRRDVRRGRLTRPPAVTDRSAPGRRGLAHRSGSSRLGGRDALGVPSDEVARPWRVGGEGLADDPGHGIGTDHQGHVRREEGEDPTVLRLRSSSRNAGPGPPPSAPRCGSSRHPARSGRP